MFIPIFYNIKSVQLLNVHTINNKFSYVFKKLTVKALCSLSLSFLFVVEVSLVWLRVFKIKTDALERVRESLLILKTNLMKCDCHKYDKNAEAILRLELEINELVQYFNRCSLLLLIKNFLVFKKLNLFYSATYKNTVGDGYYYIRGLIIIFFVDACVTDDEPLWEPIEWSLVQTWILFIFIFAWIAENLVTSRFGSFTGRDKRIWFAWYKTFWLIDLSYIVSYGLTALFVIVPFYYELTYNLSFVISWWNWYSRLFFFKFISMYTLVIVASNLLLLNIRWLNWKKLILIIFAINFFIAYLLYTHFITSFFGYFTNSTWYQKVRPVDYIQLSHEPLKWGWGNAGRDHFPYHKVSTVFWFKNDGPFAGAFLMLHLFLFLTIFFLYIYWLVLLRRVYATKEITFTFTSFCVSALKQFFYFFLLIYILVFMSFIVSYWRFPIEFIWMINSCSWINHFCVVVKAYIMFFSHLFV